MLEQSEGGASLSFFVGGRNNRLRIRYCGTVHGIGVFL